MLQTTDPVTREIIKNALMSAADTMALTVVRTARSAVIKHGMDFSTALFNAEGLQVAQGLTLPPHLGSMAPGPRGRDERLRRRRQTRRHLRQQRPL